MENKLQEQHETLSLWLIITSPYTFGFVFFFLICLWRTKKFFAMNICQIIQSLSNKYNPHDTAKAAAWAESSLAQFNLVSGFAAIPAFGMGVVTDRCGVLVSLGIVNGFGVLMVLPVVVMEHLYDRPHLVNLLLALSCLSYMVCSGFLFGMVTAYNIKVFGFEHISSLQGCFISLAGVVSFISDLISRREYIKTGRNLVDITSESSLFIWLNMAAFAIPTALYLYGVQHTKGVESESSDDRCYGEDASSDISRPVWLPFLSAIFVHAPENASFKNPIYLNLENQIHGSQIVSATPIRPISNTILERQPSGEEILEEDKSQAERFIEKVIDGYQYQCSRSGSPVSMRTRSPMSHRHPLGRFPSLLASPLSQGDVTGELPIESFIDSMVDRVQVYEFSHAAPWNDAARPLITKSHPCNRVQQEGGMIEDPKPREGLQRDRTSDST